jgi:hypothetical protein
VSDAGLVHLRNLTNLEHLYLANTQVSDRGLPYLEDLVRLRQIVVRGSRVTDAGLDRLLESLPRVNVNVAE